MRLFFNAQVTGTIQGIEGIQEFIEVKEIKVVDPGAMRLFFNAQVTGTIQGIEGIQEFTEVTSRFR